MSRIVYLAAVMFLLCAIHSAASCLISSDCPSNKTCVPPLCVDPCFVCGKNAKCEVNNHAASCSCPPGYTGNPFSSCSAA